MIATTKKASKIQLIPICLSMLLVIATTLASGTGGRASAAPLSQTIVRLNRLAYTTNTGGRVCAKPATAGTETSVAVTFPTNAATDYVVNATPANWVATGVADTSLGATAWPNLSGTAATTVSGKVVTWTMSAGSAMAVGTLYCFDFNPTNAANVLTTANNNTENTTGTVQTQTSGNTPLDTGSYSIGLASGAVGQGDQIAITGGTVPPTFKFTLSGNTDAFTGPLSLTAPVSTAGRNLTIITNAANGYVVWAKNTNAGTGAYTGVGALRSVTAVFSLAGTAAVGTASRTIANGSQDYGMGVTVTTNGSATAAATAAYDGTTNKVGTLDPTGTFQPIARATSPTGTDVYNIFERASMSPTTEAATDYADTIYLTGAGLF